jgi:hypothetical protein
MGDKVKTCTGDRERRATSSNALLGDDSGTAKRTMSAHRFDTEEIGNTYSSAMSWTKVSRPSLLQARGMRSEADVEVPVWKS